MADIAKRYPMSTQDGQAIPLDILRPHSVLALDITGVASAAIAIPTDVEFFSIFSGVDAVLKFGTAGVVAVDLASGVAQSSTIFIPKDMVMFISPPLNLTHFSIITRDAGSGEVIIQYYESWTALSTKPQHQRR